MKTTFDDLFTVCVNNDLKNIKTLSAYYELPFKIVYETVKQVNRGVAENKDLFSLVQQTLLADTFYIDEYELHKDEELVHIDSDLYITSFATILRKRVKKCHGVTFEKFVEIEPTINCRVRKSERNKNARYYAVVSVKNKMYYLHKIMAEHFVPNPDNLPLLKFVSDNTLDYHPANLKWSARNVKKNHTDVLDVTDYSLPESINVQF